MRFILALIVAGAWQVWLVVKEGFEQAKIAWRAFQESKNPQSVVSLEMQEARIAVCEKCPIFYKPLRTCGSPLARKDWVNSEPLGCFCFMNLKSKTKSNCWISQKTFGAAGWTRALDSYPEDYECPPQP